MYSNSRTLGSPPITRALLKVMPVALGESSENKVFCCLLQALSISIKPMLNRKNKAFVFFFGSINEYSYISFKKGIQSLKIDWIPMIYKKLVFSLPN